MVIDDIKNSLDKNPNLSDDVKGDFFELILLLHKYYPEMSLTTLNERIKTVRIEVVGKYISKDPIVYNEYTNVLQINQTELQRTSDTKHILMVALLQMIPKPTKDENHLMDGFRQGFAELVAGSLVGSENYE